MAVKPRALEHMIDTVSTSRDHSRASKEGFEVVEVGFKRGSATIRPLDKDMMHAGLGKRSSAARTGTQAPKTSQTAADHVRDALESLRTTAVNREGIQIIEIESPPMKGPAKPLSVAVQVFDDSKTVVIAGLARGIDPQTQNALRKTATSRMGEMSKSAGRDNGLSQAFGRN